MPSGTQLHSFDIRSSNGVEIQGNDHFPLLSFLVPSVLLFATVLWLHCSRGRDMEVAATG